MEQVKLRIQNKVFVAHKQLLCKYSDYFKIMFNGKFIEDKKKEIVIDVVNPSIMFILLQYMETGFVNITHYKMSTINEILVAARFFQIIPLLKEIEKALHRRLTLKNLFLIMTTAVSFLFNELENFCAMFGLYSFSKMRPEYIPTIHNLVWYLSNPYLDTKSELKVFYFGFKWFERNETGADVLLLLLSCLDFSKITLSDMQEVRKCLRDFDGSLPFKVTECYYELLRNGLQITVSTLNEQKSLLQHKFGGRVYKEALLIVSNGMKRCHNITPVLPVQKKLCPNNVPSNLFVYTDSFEPWLDVGEKEWGWSIVSWGATKLVVVSSEDKTPSRGIRVYDTIRQQWTTHEVRLPIRSLAGMAVLDDTLFILGGLGESLCSAALKSAATYNLKDKTYKQIEDLPEGLIRPSVCVHKDKVYVAAHHSIYCYDDSGPTAQWKTVIVTYVPVSCMTSYRDRIYCTPRCLKVLCYFEPNINKSLEVATKLEYSPAALLNLGERLAVITNLNFGDVLTVVQFPAENQTKAEMVYCSRNNSISLNMISGFCALTMRLPSLCKHLSVYQKQYLKSYPE